ncbi:hypothetical protein SOVF_009410 isoform B [Spinacia oleracea]|nr:hypothetical protein SOVF_009410 isoform B [Spinacia oleracea]
MWLSVLVLNKSDHYVMKYMDKIVSIVSKKERDFKVHSGGIFSRSYQ